MKSKNMIYFKPRKYKNVTCFVDGIRFDSRREADYYGQLKIEKKAGLIKEFERQVLFGLKVNGDNICAHRVDFLVTLKDGSLEVREVKGFETNEWNIKRKLFESLYPNIPYKVIK
jgi:hypothetical protein